MDLYLDRIKPLFESSGETDKEIEESLGLPRGVIYKWGMGENKSYKKFIPQIAKKYRVSADYLMGLVDSAIPEQKESAPDPKIEGEKYTVEMWEKQAEQWSDEELNQAVWKLLKIQERRQKNGN